jgi:hypothetical protein
MNGFLPKLRQNLSAILAQLSTDFVNIKKAISFAKLSVFASYDLFLPKK